MEHIDKNEFMFMLCAIGYLPPRTEQEEDFFEQMYEGYKPNFNNRHIDVDAIIRGECQFISPEKECQEHKQILVQRQGCESKHMAARNFCKLPKDIVNKIKSQHKDIK